MNKMKIVSLILFVLLVCGCNPRRFVYQQGPTAYSVLADGKTAQQSIQRATGKARQVCYYKHRVTHLIQVTTTPASIDNVKVENHYLYVIEDTAPTNYFTVAQFICESTSERY